MSSPNFTQERDAPKTATFPREDSPTLPDREDEQGESQNDNDTDEWHEEWDANYCDITELDLDEVFGLDTKSTAKFTAPTSKTSTSSPSSSESTALFSLPSATAEPPISTPGISPDFDSPLEDLEKTAPTQDISTHQTSPTPIPYTFESGIIAPAPTPFEVIPKLRVRDSPLEIFSGDSFPAEFHYFPFLPPHLRIKILRLACPPPSTLRIQYSADSGKDGGGENKGVGEWKFCDADSGALRDVTMVKSLSQGWKESRSMMLDAGWGVVNLKKRREHRCFNFKSSLMVWQLDVASEKFLEGDEKERSDMRVAIPRDIPISNATAASVRSLGVCEELWLTWPFAPPLPTARNEDPDWHKQHATDPWKAEVITQMTKLEIFKLLIPSYVYTYRQKRLTKIVDAKFSEVLAEAEDGAVRRRPRVEVAVMKNV